MAFHWSREWQQISLSHQDSSQYSGWSQYCCSFDGLDSSSDFQLLQFFYQAFESLFQAHQ